MPDADLTRGQSGAGFFGKIPAAGDFVNWNLPRAFTDRWDRWMSLGLRAQPATGQLDPRAWRFFVRPGIFGDMPVAGVWRMSEDRAGRRYPFVIARLGAPPEPIDPWFDAVASATSGVFAFQWPPDRIADALRRIEAPRAQAASETRIAFWLDDWEVHEFTFTDVHDLAQNGLPALRAARLAAGEV